MPASSTGSRKISISWECNAIRPILVSEYVLFPKKTLHNHPFFESLEIAKRKYFISY